MIRILLCWILICFLTLNTGASTSTSTSTSISTSSKLSLDLNPSQASAPGGQEKNGLSPKSSFIITHSIIAQANFGVALPLSLGGDSFTPLLAANLITAPINVGGHLFFVRKKEFTPSHAQVMNWTTLSFLALSYSTPLTFLEDFSDAARVGALATFITYPFGIWSGYELGSAYAKNTESFHSQSLGVTSFGILGGFLGTELAVLSKSFKSGIDALYPITMGSSMGTMAGLLFFRKGNLTPTQHLWNLSGLLGGVVMGSGILIILEDDYQAFTDPTLTTSILSTGAFIGYAAMYFITKGMTPSQTGEKSNPGPRYSFNPFPNPEFFRENGKIHKRYRIPGFTMTLPWF